MSTQFTHFCYFESASRARDFLDTLESDPLSHELGVADAGVLVLNVQPDGLLAGRSWCVDVVQDDRPEDVVLEAQMARLSVLAAQAGGEWGGTMNFTGDRSLLGSRAIQELSVAGVPTLDVPSIMRLRNAALAWDRVALRSSDSAVASALLAAAAAMDRVAHVLLELERSRDALRRRSA